MALSGTAGDGSTGAAAEGAAAGGGAVASNGGKALSNALSLIDGSGFGPRSGWHSAGAAEAAMTPKINE
jgi:hypothetical protein